jgi:hypothetical protein
MGLLNFQVNGLFDEGAWASPPWGRRERGLVCNLTKILGFPFEVISWVFTCANTMGLPSLLLKPIVGSPQGAVPDHQPFLSPKPLTMH